MQINLHDIFSSYYNHDKIIDYLTQPERSDFHIQVYLFHSSNKGQWCYIKFNNILKYFSGTS